MRCLLALHSALDTLGLVFKLGVTRLRLYVLEEVAAPMGTVATNYPDLIIHPPRPSSTCVQYGYNKQYVLQRRIINI
ncbi:hypothetical protein DFJ58DRAFT_278949 [Suillus subalutaceus]|uniref:uncharacterized protein n=1 Tax=Suillus subalutaceus TaxID=48586 RepID=UPI001B875836|nr:uncharacterized protein DFJ58DRAFT_278949 [Suillus subalutaceus]KAG1860138.1 hypothetical protein DFJ58DRAFT_278949 [Suillus subalutaceus]